MTTTKPNYIEVLYRPSAGAGCYLKIDDTEIMLSACEAEQLLVALQRVIGCRTIKTIRDYRKHTAGDYGNNS